VFLWLNSLSLIPFINHGKDGRREKNFYPALAGHEIRENITNTINPFQIRERNLSTTGSHGEKNPK
jgi:hypothetical protein